MPKRYLRGLGVRSRPRISEAEDIRIVNLRAGGYVRSLNGCSDAPIPPAYNRSCTRQTLAIICITKPSLTHAPTLYTCDIVCIVTFIPTRQTRSCAGTRVVVDGLMQAIDDGEESDFAKIHPIDPNETDWVTGFVRERFLTLVSLYQHTVGNHVGPTLKYQIHS